MKKILFLSPIMMSLMFVTNAFGQTLNSAGVQAVDIGLSVKWADRNLGADSPSDYGDYYAWGEIETKSDYSWATYKWCKGFENSLTKYNISENAGIVDNKTQLDKEDDVAYINLGEGWRLPTYFEIAELFATMDNKDYKWEWTSMKNHRGYKITYRVNKQSIFLPASGYRAGTSLHNVGVAGFYLSSFISVNAEGCAWLLRFYSAMDVYTSRAYHRYLGQSVRPVKD